MSQSPQPDAAQHAWRARLEALRNLPPVLRIVWECGPTVVVWSILLRVLVALAPVALLAVSP